MVFSDIPFLFYLFPGFLILYLGAGKIFSRAGERRIFFQNLILLIASLIFYAWGEPVYILLLILSSVVDYSNGRFLEKFTGNRKKQKIFLIISVVVNLGLMAIFKYMTLFITTINAALGSNIKDPELALPLGISFFTFQTMSYSIDVYRGKVKAERNFLYYMTYVCMFPQLVAGPIVRYEDISKELKDRNPSFDDMADGLTRFLMGLFKKVLIANQIGSLFDEILVMSDRSVLTAWLGLLAFSLQIYFDFSGYSDMAIGMGRMMGFTYPENFNYPYISKTITEFWRRWHITLSGFFKDYVYIPLGGNRCGKARQTLNLLIVWALTGFWHGASWNYLLWGLYFGVILILEKNIIGKKELKGIKAFLGHIYSVIVIMIGWMIFAVEDFSKLKDYCADVFFYGAESVVDVKATYELRNYILIIALGIIFSTPIFPALKKWLAGKKIENAAKNLGYILAMLLLIVTIAMIVASDYNPFLYFRF